MRETEIDNGVRYAPSVFSAYWPPVRFLLTFASADESTGTLVIKMHAASVDTGSGMKNANSRARTFSMWNRIL